MGEMREAARRTRHGAALKHMPCCGAPAMPNKHRTQDLIDAARLYRCASGRLKRTKQFMGSRNARTEDADKPARRARQHQAVLNKASRHQREC